MKTGFNFPGGPVVKILCFQCRGHGFDSWTKGTKILHPLWQKKLKNCKTKTKNWLKDNCTYQLIIIESQEIKPNYSILLDHFEESLYEGMYYFCFTVAIPIVFLPLLFHDFIVFFMSSKSCGILQARIPEWVAFPFSRGIFPTPGSNPGLPHCRQILYQLSHKGSPRILEWVSYPFSSRSSQPRN